MTNSIYNRNPYQSSYFNNNMQQQTQQQLNQNIQMGIQEPIQPAQQIPSIKGKYINSLDDVIGFSTNDVEPAVFVDLSNGKMYIKTFNIDGSYKIEEFIRNENAKIDTRSQTEKLTDLVTNLADNVKILTNEMGNIKNELGMGGIKNEQSNA